MKRMLLDVVIETRCLGNSFCITVDHQSLEDQTVTLRERDSMEQKRVAIQDLKQPYKLKFQTNILAEINLISLFTKEVKSRFDN